LAEGQLKSGSRGKRPQKNLIQRLPRCKGEVVVMMKVSRSCDPFS